MVGLLINISAIRQKDNVSLDASIKHHKTGQISIFPAPLACDIGKEKEQKAKNF